MEGSKRRRRRSSRSWQEGREPEEAVEKEGRSSCSGDPWSAFGAKCIQNHCKNCGFCKSRPSRAGETTAKCIPTAFLRCSVNPSWRADADAGGGDDGELKTSGLRPSDRAYEDMAVLGLGSGPIGFIAPWRFETLDYQPVESNVGPAPFDSCFL